MLTPGQALWIINNLPKHAPDNIPADLWNVRRDRVISELMEIVDGGLTLPAPDKGDSPAPENLSTPEGFTAAGNEPTPAPCG